MGEKIKQEILQNIRNLKEKSFMGVMKMKNLGMVENKEILIITRKRKNLDHLILQMKPILLNHFIRERIGIEIRNNHQMKVVMDLLLILMILLNHFKRERILIEIRNNKNLRKIIM